MRSTSLRGAPRTSRRRPSSKGWQTPTRIRDLHQVRVRPFGRHVWSETCSLGLTNRMENRRRPNSFQSTEKSKNSSTGILVTSRGYYSAKTAASRRSASNSLNCSRRRYSFAIICVLARPVPSVRAKLVAEPHLSLSSPTSMSS